MAIPNAEDIKVPVLELLTQRGSVKVKDFQEPLSKSFRLTSEELSQGYESGNGRIFLNRIRFALSRLCSYGFAYRPERGVYKITKNGREYLRESGSKFWNFMGNDEQDSSQTGSNNATSNANIIDFEQRRKARRLGKKNKKS